MIQSTSNPTEMLPSFFIGQIPVYGKVILAPMDGLSDLPTRSLAREFGSALSYTEFLNTIDILNQNRDIHERMSFLEAERPVIFQLLDQDPIRMLQAAQMVMVHHPDAIDINLGCPSRAITSRGAGAALMQKPDVIGKAISLLVKNIPVPITAKIRLGWDDKNMNYLEIARIIEDSGGSLVAVHGRTRAQAYQGSAVWEPIGEVKQALRIPVLANGDIRTPTDITNALEQTGCDGVMIGRAALGNPWLFARRDISTIGIDETIETIYRHLDKMISFYGEIAGVLFFRKHLKAYIKQFNIKRSEMVALMTVPDRNDVSIHLNQLKIRIQSREADEN